jgi:hypothetical protein
MSLETAAQPVLLRRERSCRGNIPWVPWATAKIQDTIGSLQWQMAGESYTPYQKMTPPLQAEDGGGAPTKKELILEMIHAITSPPYD